MSTATIQIHIDIARAPARAWWQVVTVRTWYGFGMRNLTVRLRGRVVLKLAVAA